MRFESRLLDAKSVVYHNSTNMRHNRLRGYFMSHNHNHAEYRVLVHA